MKRVVNQLLTHKTAFFYLTILTIITLVVIWGSVQVIRAFRATCHDFKTQREAMRAYSLGATQLDRDKDGKPCEKLPK